MLKLYRVKLKDTNQYLTKYDDYNITNYLGDIYTSMSVAKSKKKRVERLKNCPELVIEELIISEMIEVVL